MSLYPTPHIDASPEDIAKTVLMPGDPLRSEFIAKNYLDSPVLFNNVRGVQGYTGKYRGVPVSVMASGMGMPSIGIYSYELYNYFGVENIIRVGSAGAMQENIRLRDIVMGMGACTESGFVNQYHLPGVFSPIADFGLLCAAVKQAEKLGVNYHVGNLLSSDHFYYDDPEDNVKWRKMRVMAVEMEAAALYMNAARAGKCALAICTVSDHLINCEALTTGERQTSFNQMIEVALNTVYSLYGES